MKVKNRLRALLAMVVTVCMLTTSGAVLAAENSGIQPRLTGVRTLGASLAVNTFGRASCSADCDLRTGYTGTLTMELQQSEDGLFWETIKTWSDSVSGVSELYKIHYVASGYYYNVVATVDVYDSAGTFIESVTEYSSVESH